MFNTTTSSPAGSDSNEKNFEASGPEDHGVKGRLQLESTEPDSHRDSTTYKTYHQSEDNSLPNQSTDVVDRVTSRIASRVTSRSTITPGPPPDGGLRAWLCVFGTFLVVMNTWGMINSFGAFQSYYVQTLDRSPSDISWIGSVEIFLLFSIGTFTGRLTDAGYFRPVAAAGSVLVVAGTLAASACTRYWQLLLAQGVCVGLGNGCLFCPAVALVSTYFAKRRAFAIGITACGSGAGGVVFPVVIREMLPRAGFGWTMRTLGFIQAAALFTALSCLKPRVPPRKTGSLLEWAAFRELEYTFYAVGASLCFWASYIVFFFLAAYARDIQGASYDTSLDLLIIANGVGILGRLVLNSLADRVGNLTMFVPTAGAAAVLAYCWAALPIASSSSRVGLYVWAALSGIALGGIQALFPSALASLTADPRKQGARIGMVFTIVSVSVLTGPPIAGALVSALGGRYLGAQMFAGSSLMLGMVFIFSAREAKRKRVGGSFWAKV
ncbi:riboflavin transporter MCH5 [Colletotrichum abscissum]|uniref:Riboflavin transporter MCH5 n=1 Tax=Colletotrichum abscissum TaxID=1671311 RepID=A0A9Q0B1T6_9PEZI|nr:riboflavin transporter MCH5 [Colletotrichum abscissum]KAI3544191.1 riboflavin transporter MCH5 [Colletotrichum abscissum]KAK1525226.1 riboflavin transporter MCH5 [Colletotrichum abscissum]